MKNRFDRNWRGDRKRRNLEQKGRKARDRTNTWVGKEGAFPPPPPFHFALPSIRNAPLSRLMAGVMRRLFVQARLDERDAGREIRHCRTSPAAFVFARFDFDLKKTILKINVAKFSVNLISAVCRKRYGTQ